MNERVGPHPFVAKTADGWVLRGEVLAEPRQKGVALLLHAMMASRRSLDKPRGKGLASSLAESGLGVVVADLRGHGESLPSARDGARFSYDDFILEDIPTLVAHARATFPGERVIVVGHSLGAHAALISAGVFPDAAPDAIVSIAGNVWVPSCEPNLARRARKTATLRVWLGITEAVGYFDPRPLRIGTDAVALPYVRQFWQMWSTDRLESLDGTRDYRAALTRVTCPVFSVASEGDKLLAHPEAVSRFLSLMPHAQVRERIIRKNELSGKAPDHMGLVTNPSSAPVWREIADFALGG